MGGHYLRTNFNPNLPALYPFSQRNYYTSESAPIIKREFWDQKITGEDYRNSTKSTISPIQSKRVPALAKRFRGFSDAMERSVGIAGAFRNPYLSSTVPMTGVLVYADSETVACEYLRFAI